MGFWSKLFHKQDASDANNSQPVTSTEPTMAPGAPTPTPVDSEPTPAPDSDQPLAMPDATEKETAETETPDTPAA